MKRKLLIAMAVVALACGAAWWWVRDPAPGAAPAAIALASQAPASASSGAPDPVPAAIENLDPDQLALGIETALVSSDAALRETAFHQMLPALLVTDATHASRIFERQPPGEMRDALRDELARQWIIVDRDSAAGWLHSLDEGERRAGASTAMRTLAARSPAQAIALAQEFGIGHDDGSLEHLVQLWATEDLDAATRWAQSQTEPAYAPLRARIEQVRSRRGEAAASREPR